jgi:Xaa-Pro aminopeptidase
MKIEKHTAHLITKPENIVYLTGFKASFAVLILTSEKWYLITDQRYWIKAVELRAQSLELRKKLELIDVSTEWIQKLEKELKSIKTVCFEEGHLTVAGLKSWKKKIKKMPSSGPFVSHSSTSPLIKGEKSFRWKEGNEFVEKMRLVKRADELKQLKRAGAIADKAFKTVMDDLKVGVTERHIHNRLVEEIRRVTEDISFEPIVCFGVSSALPHHESSTRKLKKNDIVLIDMGAKFEGYCSDMTRTFFFGLQPDEELKKMLQLTLKAQAEAVKMVKAGVKISDLDKKAREILGEYDKYFTHSLGHGVGLEVHEAPGVSGRSKTVLEEGMVITIEPGVYKEGLGGIRIEDTLYVTKTGSINLTRFPK